MTDEKCLHCDGIGWVEARSFVKHGVSYVQWARCPVCAPTENEAASEGAA